MMRKGMVVIGLIVPFLWGDFTRTSGLVDIPTTPGLKPGEFRFITNTSFNLRPGFNYPVEADLAVRYGINNRAEIVISAFHFDAYALSGIYQLLEETTKRPSICFGIDNITYNSYVSPIDIGKGKTFRDHQYLYRNPEIFSTYFSFTKNFYFVTLTAGLGRGRFVGYGPRSRYFNTDGLFGEGWKTGHGSAIAIGLFFGLGFRFAHGFDLIFEMDGRDGNIGARYNFKHGALNLSFSHIEGTFSAEGGPAGHFASRLSAGVEVSNLLWTGRIRHGVIAGSVIDETNQELITNVFLEIKELNKRFKIRKGKFKLTLRGGGYTFELKKEGYNKRIQHVRVKPGRTVQYTFYMAKTPEAIKKAQQAESLEVIMKRAVYFYNSDSLLQAKEQLKRALEIDPNYEDAKTYLAATNKKISQLIGIYRTNALVATDRRDYQTAIENWNKVLILDPENERAKGEIAVLKKLIGKKKVTPKVTKPKKKASREEIEALYRRGVRLFGQKRYKEALKVFNSVLKLDPNHTGAKRYKARTEARLRAAGG